jgi:hypothetical protein
MKKLALVVLLLLSTLTYAAKKPNPADYTINVHVTASHLQLSHNVLPVTSGAFQKLDVVMNGKRLELSGGEIQVSLNNGAVIIVPGDYKARLVINENSNSTYKSSEVYELIVPDNKTEKFIVTGLGD